MRNNLSHFLGHTLFHKSALHSCQGQTRFWFTSQTRTPLAHYTSEISTGKQKFAALLSCLDFMLISRTFFVHPPMVIVLITKSLYLMMILLVKEHITLPDVQQKPRKAKASQCAADPMKSKSRVQDTKFENSPMMLIYTCTIQPLPLCSTITTSLFFHLDLSFKTSWIDFSVHLHYTCETFKQNLQNLLDQRWAGISAESCTCKFPMHIY